MAGTDPQPRPVAAGVLALVGAGVLIGGSFLSWVASPGGNVLYLFGVPPAGHGGETVTIRDFHVRGLSTGAGQVVFGSGLALAVMTVILLARPGLRRRGWLTLLPGLVAAGAVGHWHRQESPAFFFSIGRSVIPLLGTLAVCAATGLWATGAARDRRLARAGLAVILAILICGVATVVGPHGQAVLGPALLPGHSG